MEKPEISPERVLDALLDERRIIAERCSLFLRTLASFNPLLITVATGGIVALFTKGFAGQDSRKVAFMAFAVSPLGFAIGAFNFMILTWLRIEGRYIARLESEINELVRVPGLLCRELLVTPAAIRKSGVYAFFGIFISVVVGFGTFLGWWSALHWGKPSAVAMVAIESVAMAGAIIYEIGSARKAYDVSIARSRPSFRTEGP